MLGVVPERARSGAAHMQSTSTPADIDNLTIRKRIATFIQNIYQG